MSEFPTENGNVALKIQRRPVTFESRLTSLVAEGATPSLYVHLTSMRLKLIRLAFGFVADRVST
jgi:hypothetical protein